MRPQSARVQAAIQYNLNKICSTFKASRVSSHVLSVGLRRANHFNTSPRGSSTRWWRRSGGWVGLSVGIISLLSVLHGPVLPEPKISPKK
mmetsp:Transcript_2350/g.6277  ORF Transcript_2350/g.6277 Transcript_2350/m.6277 type:complete len:90 (-) Transcript_2350:801-1070(-)